MMFMNTLIICGNLVETSSYCITCVYYTPLINDQHVDRSILVVLIK